MESRWSRGLQEGGAGRGEASAQATVTAAVETDSVLGFSDYVGRRKGQSKVNSRRAKSCGADVGRREAISCSTPRIRSLASPCQRRFAMVFKLAATTRPLPAWLCSSASSSLALLEAQIAARRDRWGLEGSSGCGRLILRRGKCLLNSPARPFVRPSLRQVRRRLPDILPPSTRFSFNPPCSAVLCAFRDSPRNPRLACAVG